ncbi:MAG: cupin domain-containing protein [Bacteroidota bacterium]
MKSPKHTSLNQENPSIIGGKRQIILSAQETEGDIYLVEGIMPAGSTVPIHLHQHEDEIFHVLKGKVELVLGEQTLIGEVGDIIYLPRGIKHGIKTVGEETARVLNYVIPGKNFEAFFDEMNSRKVDAQSDDAKEIALKYGISFL